VTPQQDCRIGVQWPSRELACLFAAPARSFSDTEGVNCRSSDVVVITPLVYTIGSIGAAKSL